MNIIERFESYDDLVCWQYHQKQQTAEEDYKLYGLKYGDISVKDLDFSYVPPATSLAKDVTNFIERYEWLGKMPTWSTHRFIATYNDVIVGAVVMSTPYAFSNILGRENKNLEKMVARGASTSFAPKNLASFLIMNSIKWMALNTEFRVFTAYADPMAKELGTVYQACNWIYLGQNYGGGKLYLDPENIKAGWVGDSYFTLRATIKRIAIESGVEWEPEYICTNPSGRKRIINWDAIPEDVKLRIKTAIKNRKANSKIISVPRKHKYMYIQGKDKRETKYLTNLFKQNNPELVGLSYPKTRGEY